MLAKLIACSLSLVLLGCLLLGCSDDTRRVTSKGTILASDPLSTSVDESDGQSTTVNDTGYVFYPYDTTSVDIGDTWPDTDDPMDRFSNDDHGSGKEIDNRLGRK